MTDHPDTPSPNFDDAAANAARLLQWAEGEMDLAKQRNMTDIAQSWIALADLIHERQQT